MKRLRKHIIATITIFAAAFMLAVMTAGAQTANVAGNWKLTLETPNGAASPSLVLKQDGEKLTGTYESARYGQSELKGSIKEKEIEFSVSFVAEGMQTQGVFGGTVDGDTMSGNCSFEGAGDGTWSASRVKSQ